MDSASARMKAPAAKLDPQLKDGDAWHKPAS
jgi:hypothetical protein